MSAFINPVASPVLPQAAQSGSSKVRQSVGHFPVQAPQSSAGPYPQLYTPHPMPRQKIYFGPYILLQTLGEGEFGKVKLGVHSERWGEDVAIKLIKRGNVDTAQRGEKVRREIEVLKAVRHPNIVRLYDVIETEKYIGIVLEYASGAWKSSMIRKIS
jgi:protein-serine/threonine kinase